jgi:hypothetical protein
MDLDNAPSPRGNSRSTGSAWSASDDEKLIAARVTGKNWHDIRMKYFRNRKSPNACRKRHERLMFQALSDDLDGPRMDELVLAYMDKREEMWLLVAEKVGFRDWKTLEHKVRGPLTQ